MLSVPLAILTGMAGAGKTALLEAAMTSGMLQRAAVIVHDPARRSPDAAFEPAPGGCVCCTLRDDLVVALLSLGRRAVRGEIPAFERVVVETAGSADPAPLLQSLAGSAAFAVAYRLDALVTVIDARRGCAAFAPEDAVFHQALLADRLLLTNWTPVAAGELAALENRLAMINPHAQRLRVAQDAAGRGWFDPAAPAAAAVAPLSALRAGDDAAFASFALSWDHAQSLASIGDWLQAIVQDHGARLLRVNGVVAAAGEPRAISIHAVRHVIAGPALFPGAVSRSRVVFRTRGLEPGDVLPPWPVAAESARTRPGHVPAHLPAGGVGA